MLIVNILSDTTPSHQQGLTTLRGSRDLIKYAVNTALQKLKEVILNPFDKNVHTHYLQDYLSWNASTCSMTQPIGPNTQFTQDAYRILACVASVWKGKERGFWAWGKREVCARREGTREFPSLPPRAPARVSLAPKTLFPFPFKRLPRRLIGYINTWKDFI